MLAARNSRVVLIVEDDPQLRELYRTALASHGYPVVAVGDGIDALRVIEAATVPAAVVLDLELPRLGGLDLYQELRARAETSTIPIVIVTAGDTSRLDPTRFACILKKPMSVEALVTAVEDCLHKR
jgi:DNA-binding response OmpR family regulator